jgi:hypothetical protein
MIRDMIRGLDDSWVPDTTLLTRLSLAHSLNLYCNLSWSLQQWEHRFGTFSTSHPWGCDFWAGMNGLLAEYRFPPDSITLARAAHFKLPANFSKQAALNCPGPLNPPVWQNIPMLCLGHNVRQWQDEIQSSLPLDANHEQQRMDC